MSKLGYTLFTIIYLTAFPLMAQEDIWTFADCIAYARQHNMQIQDNTFAERSAELEIYYAKKAFVPTITLGTSVNVGIGRTIDPFTNQFTTEPVVSNSWNANARLTVFNGLQLHANLKKARLSQQTTQLSSQQTNRDLEIQIANAYLQILFNKEQLTNSQKQLRLSKAEVDRTYKLIGAGRLPESKIYELQVQVTNSEVQTVAAENNLLIAKLALKQLLGLPAEKSIDVEFPTIAEPDSSFLFFSFDELAKLASVQPEAQISSIDIQKAEIDLRQAKRAYLPNLSISYGVGTLYSSQARSVVPGDGEPQTIITPIGFVSSDGGQTSEGTVYQENVIGPQLIAVQVPYEEQFRDNINQSTNLNFSIPFLSSATSLKQGLRNSRLALEKAKMKAFNQQNQLKQTLYQKFVEAQAAFQTYKINQKKHAIQQVAYAHAESKYQKGQINAFEYTTEKNNLWNSENELLRSRYDAVLKIKILKYYMGEELSF
ncbi:TolC family protein [Roseivirga sp. BDSF3-8]|uniref:TolC family protein n=1 Tax=Roseivirga sp. BDSF3-8 TaxID=3241598 RepID=UPI0035318903